MRDPAIRLIVDLHATHWIGMRFSGVDGFVRASRVRGTRIMRTIRKWMLFMRVLACIASMLVMGMFVRFVVHVGSGKK